MIIYGLTRFVLSNLGSVDTFINNYFSGHMKNAHKPGAVLAPAAKYLTMGKEGHLTDTSGRVTFSMGGDVPENHPINNLLEDLIAVFHARYVVLKWEESVRKRQKKSANVQVSTSQSTAAVDVGLPDTQKPIPNAVLNAVRKQTPMDKRDPPKKPTAEMYEQKQRLDSHEYMRALLHEYIFNPHEMKAPQWPANDVVPDQLIKLQGRRGAPSPTCSAGTERSGRRRTPGVEEASPRARPRTSARRGPV